MKIQVSKVFADFINKTVKGVDAQVVKLTDRQYRFNCGDPWDAGEHGDYDWQTGLYKAILVCYPADYYACPRYVSTKELTGEFRRQGVKDWEGLKEMLKDMLTI